MSVVRKLSPLSLLGCLAVILLPAQSPNGADWQAAAGGTGAFDVASVKRSQAMKIPNFPLDSRNAKAPGGRLSASFPLSGYIMFAYKLEPWEAKTAMADAPKWVRTDLYEIEARAEGNPTKDQMRLMVQSMLAERFKLAVHFDNREVPVFALTLVKPGRPGPKLRPHSEGPPCPDLATPSVPPGKSDVFPPNCDTQQIRVKPGNVTLMGSRNSSMQSLANAVRSAGSLSGEIDRAVVDRTGLQGTFDFTVEWNGGLSNPVPSGPDAPPDMPGTSFLDAVHEQLGLKLVTSRDQVRILVIDHVERPSEN